MKQIFMLLLFLMTLASCDSGYLTRNDPTATTDKDWWKTQQQLSGALDRIYLRMPTVSTNFYTSAVNALNPFGGLTDDAIWSNNYFGLISTIAQGNGSAATTKEGGYNPFHVWNYNYEAVRLASRFIENAGKSFTEAELEKRYIAEARALRAWYHLNTFLYYRNIPIVRSSLSAEESRSLTNDASTQEIVKFIASQLDSSAVNLPYRYSNNNEAGRITKGACYAMKAILYLNSKEYQKAAKSAKKVIDLRDNQGRKVYELYHNYAGLFRYSGEINNERILVTLNTAQSVWNRNAPASLGPQASKGGMNPTASLVNTYETKQGKTLAQMSSDSAKIYKANPNYNNNRDPRFKATILYPGQTFVGEKLQPFSDDPNNPDRIGQPNGTDTGFWKRKYLDEQDRPSGTGSLDTVIIRLARIMLVRVEALVEAGNWQHSDVTEYLNMIRKRAGMPEVDLSVYNTQEKMRELYRRERRVELALEGSRWFDIRRWDIGKKAMDGQVYGAVDPETGEPIQVITRNYNSSRDDLWPIPLKDVNSSGITQNPGY